MNLKWVSATHGHLTNHPVVVLKNNVIDLNIYISIKFPSVFIVHNWPASEKQLVFCIVAAGTSKQQDYPCRCSTSRFVQDVWTLIDVWMSSEHELPLASGKIFNFGHKHDLEKLQITAF